jgi:hypothetical protein
MSFERRCDAYWWEFGWKSKFTLQVELEGVEGFIVVETMKVADLAALAVDPGPTRQL